MPRYPEDDHECLHGYEPHPDQLTMIRHALERQVPEHLKGKRSIWRTLKNEWMFRSPGTKVMLIVLLIYATFTAAVLAAVAWRVLS